MHKEMYFFKVVFFFWGRTEIDIFALKLLVLAGKRTLAPSLIILKACNDSPRYIDEETTSFPITVEDKNKIGYLTIHRNADKSGGRLIDIIISPIILKFFFLAMATKTDMIIRTRYL